MSIVEWATIVGIPSIISGIVAMLIDRRMKDRDQSQEQIRQQNEELEKQNNAIMLGVQALLRDRLLQGYRCFLDKKWADYDDRQNMENLWKQYHGLGQNGIMDHMREEFLNLPMRKEGE